MHTSGYLVKLVAKPGDKGDKEMKKVDVCVLRHTLILT